MAYGNTNTTNSNVNRNIKYVNRDFNDLRSSLINFWSLGSPAIHSVKFWGLDGSKGIILDILSTKP